MKSASELWDPNHKPVDGGVLREEEPWVIL